MTELKSCQQLADEVINKGLCTLCGACTGMCPYLVPYKGRIVTRDKCNLTDGRCHAFCPRTMTDLNHLSQIVFGSPYTWSALGTTQEVLMARATDATIRAKGQYGGTVTALVSFALDQGLIDSAALTTSEDKSLPRGVIASTPEEVLNCAGSNYVATPTLEAFNHEIQGEHHKSIGFVGTPCQLMALAKMRTATSKDRDKVDRLNLVIGLFCTWAFSYDGFARFLKEKASLSDVVRFDIPPPPANVFEIYTTSNRIRVPLDEVRGFINPGCSYCHDMTAEFSDISVGAVEGTEKWNTVIVRSDRGMRLLREAEAKGIIETGTLPGGNLSHLKEASLLKKKRALRNIIGRTGSADDLLFLAVQDGAVRQLL